MDTVLPHDMTGAGRGDENYEYLMRQADKIVAVLSSNPAQAEGTMSRLARGVTPDQWHEVLAACADKWRTMTHRPDAENPYILQP